MPKRGFLDLTPKELRARRAILFGLGLFVMPPLLTLCHLDQVVCQSIWRLDIVSLFELWPLYPWLLIVAAAMLCGLFTMAVGGVLLLLAKTNWHNPSQSQQTRTLRCVQ
jgi:hypothetical protein